MGTIKVVGVDALSESHGREFMPHPLAHNRSSPFANLDEYTAYATEVVDRVMHGDLGGFKQWFDTYVNADLRVECTVDTPDARRERIVAHRSDQFGFLAAQQIDDDVVDIYTLSPYELGAAITAFSPLTKPGEHSKVIIPELLGRPERDTEDEDDAVSVRRRVDLPDGTLVPRTEVAMFGRVQSRWQPARDHGFDRTKNAVVWVRIRDDGDYIYAPGFAHLTPMSARGLTERIDELIAEDVAAIRQSRGLS
ncbi:ESX secretion-associated protein EspG [Mycobacterium vicinigordonae]|uniref:ESX secretion-associated protein EspG n=1 Tax=Mycobacterium vicinigordonae TaxID=1719132 RepID=UPI001BB40F7B|nr:ESX secretion-associated protein EspG [Mycobacterium vicinigordonae]